jgi:SAM-dependent methyltransferase
MVPETRFGVWFQNTEIWLRYVLAEAVADLVGLLGPGPNRFGTILDAGCGAGQAFPLIADRFDPETLIGVDADPEAIRSAGAAAQGASARVRLVLGDVSRLGLPDACVDLVLCHQTLHHTSDQESALLEMRRVLKPGGPLLLAESCRRFIRSLPVRALFRHPMQVQRSADGYVRLVRAAGFVVEPENVATPSPFWARPDWGLLESLGRPPSPSAEPTQVRIIATRP